MKVGLGITTYNRPEYLQRCLEGVSKHLEKVVDVVWVHDDHSRRKYPKISYNYYKAPINKGVAASKNWLLRKLMEEECDYLFLAEDDIVPKSPKAITKYINLADISGIEHLMFAHHGKANEGKLAYRANGLDIYTNPIGAWCLYTRQVIEVVGYFDEHFKNAWEHVEHTWRIAKAGYTTPWASCPDVTGSKRYLKEIPGSIDKSSIKDRKDHLDNIINGLLYWQRKDRDFPLNHILSSLLKEEQEALEKVNWKR